MSHKNSSLSVGPFPSCPDPKPYTVIPSRLRHRKWYSLSIQPTRHFPLLSKLCFLFLDLHVSPLASGKQNLLIHLPVSTPPHSSSDAGTMVKRTLPMVTLLMIGVRSPPQWTEPRLSRSAVTEPTSFQMSSLGCKSLRKRQRGTFTLLVTGRVLISNIKRPCFMEFICEERQRTKSPVSALKRTRPLQLHLENGGRGQLSTSWAPLQPCSLPPDFVVSPMKSRRTSLLLDLELALRLAWACWKMGCSGVWGGLAGLCSSCVTLLPLQRLSQARKEKNTKYN